MDHSPDHQSNNSYSSSSSSSQDVHHRGECNLDISQGSLAVKLQNHPISFMVNVLDETCNEPDRIELQRHLLSNPFNVCKILREDPSASVKLTTYFQWLEKSIKNFVWTMVVNISNIVNQCNGLPNEHLLGFRSLLNLGTFLVESGWHAEAIVVLNIAKAQTFGYPMKMLQVLKVMVLALALSNREEAASFAIEELHTFVGMTAASIPTGLMVELHCSLAVSYFETCQFNDSCEQGLLALQLLEDEVCSFETIIGTFRQLGKSCLGMKRSYQAKLLITQAMSWAWHKFGSTSRIYAETLEDYAFYLLILNAYQDAVKVTNEAMNIYFGLYGRLGLQPELAQGNLPFRLFLESYAFNDLGPIDEYIDFLGSPEADLQKLEITGSDDRQLVALERIRPMMVIRDVCHGLCHDLSNVGIESVRPQLTVHDVRNLYFQCFE